MEARHRTGCCPPCSGAPPRRLVRADAPAAMVDAGSTWNAGTGVDTSSTRWASRRSSESPGCAFHVEQASCDHALVRENGLPLFHVEPRAGVRGTSWCGWEVAHGGRADAYFASLAMERLQAWGYAVVHALRTRS